MAGARRGARGRDSGACLLRRWSGRRSRRGRPSPATPRRDRWRARSFGRLRRGEAPLRDALQARDDERSPSRLMARADGPAVGTVEVLAEEHEILEMRVLGVAALGAMAGPRAVLPWEEYPREAESDLAGHLAQIEVSPRARGALDLEAFAVEMVIALERLHEEIVQGEPPRAPPVRVSTEEPAVGVSR